ncbi:MAG: hypothetical protein QOC74_4836 [Pseudonocardiales bacterium]|nr:hypothetical protein [Pseudonocardiales bacterium]
MVAITKASDTLPARKKRSQRPRGPSGPIRRQRLVGAHSVGRTQPDLVSLAVRRPTDARPRQEVDEPLMLGAASRLCKLVWPQRTEPACRTGPGPPHRSYRKPHI